MNSRRLLLLPLLAALLISCNRHPSSSQPISEALQYEVYNDADFLAGVDNEGFTLIDFYGLNDYHGALEYNVEDRMPGIARLNQFLKTERAKNPGGTVLIANGDMWQGSADSNMTRGKIVNHTLNHMGFAALTLGNHEFDWGIDLIEENKEYSNFPYLGANIIDKETRQTVDFVDESPLIHRSGVKIGIIGTMGSDLKTTIQTSYVDDLEFDILTSYVETEAARLREAGANLIILAAHDSWVSNVTPDRRSLLDDKVVDVVFTGHQHALDQQLINDIPILQTRGRGRDVMHARLGYNKVTQEVKLVKSEVIQNIHEMELTEDAVSTYIYQYFYEQYGIEAIKNEVLGTLINKDMTRSAVAKLVVEAMTKAYPTSVGALHNVNGGIRAEFSMGEITYNDVYSAFPFDNELYLITLSGRRLQSLMSAGGNFAYYFTLSYEEVDPNTMYQVVTISFVYELNGSPVTGLPYENMFTYPRDIVADFIRVNEVIDGNNY